jgi:1-pyrroline-4-hydroxy-2-carboxylate deaminase
MDRRDWKGVFPAITTPFHPDQSVDDDALATHVEWLLESGCDGIVPLGSLGEAATLSFDEKVRVLEVCREAITDGGHLVAGIAGLSTREGVELARAAERVGCDGVMVLPAYVHLGDERETLTHFSSVIGATSLPCMLYNNPIAYTVDVTPAQIRGLAEAHPNLHGVKESSGDARRVTAILEALDDRLAVFVGLDDMVVEGVRMGAEGWIAGLVNALPAESVTLFELAKTNRIEETRALYEWFLPLLRLDVVPKFVQLIKLVQAELGRGSETVRPPRLELIGEEREEALAVIRRQLAILDLERDQALEAGAVAIPVQKLA